jgi:hypothetical protein
MWKEYIHSGKWYGEEIPVLSVPEEHAEPDRV